MTPGNALAWFAQIAVVVAACAGVPRLIGLRSATVQHVFWRAVLGMCLLLPLVEPRLPHEMVFVPAPAGVALVPFVIATALGIIPATFAYAFFGAGLSSAVAAQESAFRACVAAREIGCRLDFDLQAAVTPELISGLAILGLIALIQPIVKRYGARRRGAKACLGAPTLSSPASEGG